MKNVLILPSWYATKDAPTSGSFFHEQSLLMDGETWNVQVITMEKEWISKRRYLYNRFLSSNINISIEEQYLTPPSGKTIFYPFCKFVSDKENLSSEINALIRYYKDHPQETPSIIHAHSVLKGGILAHYLANYLGIPYIITEHLNPFLLHNYTAFWKTEIIKAFESAHSVLAVSEHQRQQILMHSIKCNPISVGNLVDDERFIISSQPPISKTNAHFLVVTFYPNFIKDMDTFFEALALLKEASQLDGNKFTIIGGGELSGEYKENFYTHKIATLGLEKYVTVIPKANRAEMTTYMQEADCLISTSIAETFGVAICEAMLCGKPVITTLNGGVNDYATNINSIKIPIKDPNALVSAVISFRDEKNRFDPNLIRASIAEKYGRAAFWSRINNIYQSVLS